LNNYKILSYLYQICTTTTTPLPHNIIFNNKNKITMSRYTKIADQPKNQITKIRMTESQKNALQRIAYNENKTITRIILESLETKGIKL
jgi:hypothetical protein